VIIVCFHSLETITPTIPTISLPIVNIVGLGSLGTALFVFVSGSVLAVSSTDKMQDYFLFIKKRFFRIYPAFWIALMILLIAVPLPYYHFSDIIIEFTGFGAFFLWESLIDPAGWFIGLIFIYYLAFPFISQGMEKYPYQILGLSIVLSVFGLEIKNDFPLIMHNPLPLLILPYFAVFVSGIFLVKKHWYPETLSPAFISLVSEFTFYLYLIHAPILFYYQPNLVFSLVLSVFLSMFLMLIDTKIHNRIVGKYC